VCRLAKGQQLPDAQLYALYALAVMGGTMLASLFLLTDSYGPYKVCICLDGTGRVNQLRLDGRECKALRSEMALGG
jgi:hypothetical protein